MLGFDWIICALKSNSISNSPDSIHDLISPLVGSKSRILILMNGLGCEKKFCEWFGEEKVFGGMAFTCINREYTKYKGEDSDYLTVNHIAFGAVLIG